MSNKQAEIIKKLTARQVKQQLYISQGILVFISIILSVFIVESPSKWNELIEWDFYEIIAFGVFPAVIVIGIDLLLMKFLPPHFLDDGGINKKIFKNSSIMEIFFIALVVAVSEELLFRGVIHTTFGYVVASLLFSLVHIRYLYKPLLLASIIVLSFFIGYLYEVTQNLLVTITAHFFIDFCLGLIILFQNERRFKHV